MIVQANSPFRHLPVNLDRRQTLFLDGIRYAVEMIDLAYARLRQTLHQLSYLDLTNEHIKSDDSVMALRATAFLDAWSIVDSINRFRVLIEQLPKLKKRDFNIDSFMRDTINILKLRNGVQHLPGEIQKLIQNNLTVWGTLSWFTVIDAQEQIGRSCVLGAGTFNQHLGMAKLPVGKTIRVPIDCVVLSAHGYDLELTLAVDRAFKLFQDIERSLAPQVEVHKPAGADFQMHIDVKFSDEADTSSITTENLYITVDRV
ncbi:MAG: hypothetical protein QOH63_990 [Acidobacteriota bacterium]|jgi:hypothetical protein|nr:hypothetical protein [Acidobacteriota bacterium]